MAWGYTPAPISKVKKSSVGAQTSRGPGFLLVLVAVSAGVLMFGVMSEILSSPPSQENESVMIKVDEEAQEEEQLLVDPDADWKKSEGTLERKYRIHWKKPPREAEKTRGIWGGAEQDGQTGQKAGEETPWDNCPGGSKK